MFLPFSLHGKTVTPRCLQKSLPVSQLPMHCLLLIPDFVPVLGYLDDVLLLDFRR